MKLNEYLKRHNLTDGDFADLVNRNRTTVLRWRKGEARPDWEGLEAVTAATKGAVRPNDFLAIQPEQQEAS
jgi:transcriptional regulator with XRE-family HTH domain